MRELPGYIHRAILNDDGIRLGYVPTSYIFDDDFRNSREEAKEQHEHRVTDIIHEMGKTCEGDTYALIRKLARRIADMELDIYEEEWGHRDNAAATASTTAPIDLNPDEIPF